MTPHRICKCGWRFFTDADVKCPRCDKSRSAKKQRIEQIVAQQKRLISWLTFFRLPTDIGIGDTTHRLNMRSRRSPDAHRELRRLLSKCSCTPEEAVAKLNREHPYSRPTHDAT